MVYKIMSTGPRAPYPTAHAQITFVEVSGSFLRPEALTLDAEVHAVDSSGSVNEYEWADIDQATEARYRVDKSRGLCSRGVLK